MPEGDTIFRSADVLRAALGGRRVTAARAQAGPGLRRVPDLSRLVGARVSSVEPRGKHLLIGFDNGLTLRSHLRMSGSWHRYRPGERWRRPAREASAVLETAEAVAVAFNTPVVELLTDADLRRSRSLNELGPDLLAREFDVDEAIRRLHERGTEELGNALLDQRAVAGIGNVYKSEVPFLEGLDPWSSVAAIEDRGSQGRPGHGPAPAADEHARRRPGHDRQPDARAGSVGLRAGRKTLPPMRDSRRGRSPGGPGAADLLVPALPAKPLNARERPSLSQASMRLIWAPRATSLASICS